MQVAPLRQLAIPEWARFELGPDSALSLPQRTLSRSASLRQPVTGALLKYSARATLLHHCSVPLSRPSIEEVT